MSAHKTISFQASHEDLARIERLKAATIRRSTSDLIRFVLAAFEEKIFSRNADIQAYSPTNPHQKKEDKQ